jgi:hypothetical protein
VSEDGTSRDDSVGLHARGRAYELVRAVLSDRNNERGEPAARSVAAAVLAEDGIDGLADVAVDLALRLASALERIAADQGLAAVDLAEVWFTD